MRYGWRLPSTDIQQLGLSISSFATFLSYSLADITNIQHAKIDITDLFSASATHLDLSDLLTYHNGLYSAAKAQRERNKITSII